MDSKKCYWKNVKNEKFKGNEKRFAKKKIIIKSNEANTEKNNIFFEQFTAGIKDMIRNYQEMKDANMIGSDRYFHCKANCEASRHKKGGKVASYVISTGREVYGYFTLDPTTDIFKDLVANEIGRRGDANKDCKEVCSPLLGQKGSTSK
ncbi:MAG: hypothetical protein L3V56_05335 [Candidatus Magnetoovum sp. WYHC-5]|nr:hypothetical protein [Candidatus Magnetoovum sp. WYHC-5]